MSSGSSSTALASASCFLSDTIAARNALHATPAHAVPDRSHAAMGLLLDDVVLPLGAQGVLVQALELFREAKATATAAAVGSPAEERVVRLGELATRDSTRQRSQGLAAVHAALDKLEALHAQQVAMIQRAANVIERTE